MRTKQIQVFKFEELSEEIKEKVLNKHREINVNFDWWEFVPENICEEIKETTGLKITPKEIYFEILSRENKIYIPSCEIVGAIKEKYYNIDSFYLPEKFGLFCNYLGGGLCSGLNQSDFDTDRIVFYYNEDEDLEGVMKEKENQKKKEEINKDLQKIMEILEREYKGLYEEYNYLIGDEGVADTLIANEYEFDEEGEIIR